MLGFRLPFARRKGGGMGATGGTTYPVFSVPLILDQFTDTNGTALTAHAIAPTNTPATSWAAVVGTWDIQSNKARQSTAGNSFYASCNPGIADGTISADCTSPVSGDYDLGLSFRATNISNYWGAFFSSLTGTKRTQIYENTAGTGTERAGAVWSTGNNETHNVQVVLSGNSITATFDGGNTLTYTSSVRATVTKHGLACYIPGGASAVTFDNFQVTQ